MAASFVTSVALALARARSRPTPPARDYALTMLITVGVTTVVWLAVTFLTPPESEATLERFYRRVRPGGAGWRPVAERLGFGDDPIPGRGAVLGQLGGGGGGGVRRGVRAWGRSLTGSPRPGAGLRRSSRLRLSC